MLDAGGGLGGAARVLAAEYGCRVVVADVTEDYVRAGVYLTARAGLGERVHHLRADALMLPFAAGTGRSGRARLCAGRAILSDDGRYGATARGARLCAGRVILSGDGRNGASARGARLCAGRVILSGDG